MPEFSQLSLSRLTTCDERLQKLFMEVIKDTDCTIICGNRNQVDQDQAFHDGFSKLKWPNGPHNSMPSLAVDVMPSPINWNDATGIKAFSDKVKAVALAQGLDLDYGGDWQGFVDNDHYQVKRVAC